MIVAVILGVTVFEGVRVGWGVCVGVTAGSSVGIAVEFVA
jgi:hypothetical protein